jgi:hypothetical protein
MPTNSDLLQAALIGYQTELARIEQTMAEIRRELTGSAGTAPEAPKRAKRKMSAAGRRRIAAAARKRWAAYNRQRAAKA